MKMSILEKIVVSENLLNRSMMHGATFIHMENYVRNAAKKESSFNDLSEMVSQLRIDIEIALAQIGKEAERLHLEFYTYGNTEQGREEIKAEIAEDCKLQAYYDNRRCRSLIGKFEGTQSTDAPY